MKNTLSNILAWLFLVGGAVNTYLDSLCAECEIDWWVLLVAVGGAIISYFTGKTQNLKGKAD